MTELLTDSELAKLNEIQRLQRSNTGPIELEGIGE
jgi:hypothetical protein